MQKVKITIDKSGAIEYVVEGVKGGQCKDITKVIDQISGDVLSSEVTGEFCETETQTTYEEGNN